jgi:membrane associated rhomboid family serine protease
MSINSGSSQGEEEEESDAREWVFEPRKKTLFTFLREKIKKIEKPNFPYFLIVILGTIWGVYFKMGSYNEKYEKYSFMRVKNWPNCLSINQQWRLESYQLFHSNFEHILYNSVGFVIYGSLLENASQFKNRFLSSLIIHYGGVVYSALASYYIYPYTTVVGASGGLYSIIGSLTSSIILYNRNPFFKILFASYIGIDLTMEIALYYNSYDPTVAYGVHAGGFIFGFLFALAFTPSNKILWKQIVGYFAFILLIVYTSLNINYYVNVWPPLPSWNSDLRTDHQSLNCCGQMYVDMKLNGSSSKNIDYYRNNYVCINNTLINKN